MIRGRVGEVVQHQLSLCYLYQAHMMTTIDNALVLDRIRSQHEMHRRFIAAAVRRYSFPSVVVKPVESTEDSQTDPPAEASPLAASPADPP